MKPPPWEGDPSALILLDWSWWLNKAFRIAGVDGMMSTTIGWLCGLLSWRPAHLAICLDANGQTHRHKMKHPTDDQWRYKGGRDPKPPEFYAISDRCTELAEMHSIPILWAHEREADDVIATATAMALSANYRIWMCSHDKDLCALVEEHQKDGIIVGTWDNAQGSYRGPAEVMAEFGVEPSQMADYLAMMGDNSDAIPGVPHMGSKGASFILSHWPTLEDALANPPWPPEQYDITERRASQLAADIKRCREPERVKAMMEARAKIMTFRSLAKTHARLHEHAELARFSRQLTALDCAVSIAIPWGDLPVGGFQVEALRVAYAKLGFTAKAAQVPSFQKKAAWCVPFEATDPAEDFDR